MLKISFPTHDLLEEVYFSLVSHLRQFEVLTQAGAEVGGSLKGLQDVEDPVVGVY